MGVITMDIHSNSVLSNVYLFEELSPDELASLTQRATLRSFPKNAIIVNEGDETDSLYVVHTGKVKIFLSDEDGKEVILNIQGPGDYFGEISLLDDAPRSASAMTLENSKLYTIPKRQFEAFIIENPEVSLRVMRGLTKRLRTLTGNVKNLALKDVYGRIASIFGTMAEDVDGKRVIKQRLTHRDIAAMVGSSREMVSRILKDLSDGGYITVDKTSITINEKLPARW